ncbi:MAG: hypothetical protein J0H64_05265 [Actinobacteria bacterium]|nr:hypothetical protein [Actinomycetota bacterium]
MTDAVEDAALPTIADPRAQRAARLTRAIVLVLVGIVIAFTATLHRDFEFDRWLLLASLALIGAATLVEYRALRDTLESWWVAARAIIAFAAAGSLIAIADTTGMALVVVFWAVLTAVITLMRLARGVQPPRVALPSAVLSLALALVAFLVRDDSVAMVGFFGAYAVIRGVFLGISAFDGGASNGGSSAMPADHSADPDAPTTPRIESPS